MYRLIKINELEQALAVTTVDWLVIDVKDPASPTGYTTKKVLASAVAGGNDLATVLGVGNNTGGNDIQLDSGDSLIFTILGNTATLRPQLLSTDISLNLPTETGTLGLELDLPAVKIPLYNGTYGLANTGNSAYRPSISIKNRTVFIDGLLILPMPTATGGTTLDTNGAGYVTNFYGDIYTGLGDGYEVRATKDIRSRSPILPTALLPAEQVNLSTKHISRTVNLNGRTRLGAIMPDYYLLTDGTFLFTCIDTIERNGLTTTAYTKSLALRTAVDRFENNDSMVEYDNYYTSFNTGGSQDKRDLTDTGVNWNFDFDGTLAEDFGGMVVRLSFSYTIPNTITLTEIETAYNSL